MLNLALYNVWYCYSLTVYNKVPVPPFVRYSSRFHAKSRRHYSIVKSDSKIIFLDIKNLYTHHLSSTNLRATPKALKYFHIRLIARRRSSMAFRAPALMNSLSCSRSRVLFIRIIIYGAVLTHDVSRKNQVMVMTARDDRI